MTSLDRQFERPPIALCRHLTNDLFQQIADWANERHGPPCGTPDDVAHRKRRLCPLCEVHIESIPFFNTARKAEGPFIRRLKSGLAVPTSDMCVDEQVETRGTIAEV
jgi:hypothetical protein